MSRQELGIISPPEQSREEILRAREVRRKMREANPRLLTPATKADQKLWFYARTKDLIPEIIKTGNVEKEEIERLENFFEKKGTKDRLPEDLLVRFSTAVAWVAYDPLD